jgi:hypothetical protein
MPDNSFKEFVLDQLSALPELRAAETERGCPSRSTLALQTAVLFYQHATIANVPAAAGTAALRRIAAIARCC